MDKPIFEDYDARQLRSFGADLENPKLKAEYTSYRQAWDRDSQVGRMDRPTLHALAVKYLKYEFTEAGIKEQAELAQKEREPALAGSK